MIPSGVLHAPGSLCTYEVQWGSDVSAMYQSMVDGRVISWDNLVRNMPADRRDDPAYYIEMLDWDANTNPNFKRDHFKAPRPAGGSPEEGYFDRWVVYGAVDEGDLFSARELTLEPGHSTILHEPGAHLAGRALLTAPMGAGRGIAPRREGGRRSGSGIGNQGLCQRLPPPSVMVFRSELTSNRTGAPSLVPIAS